MLRVTLSGWGEGANRLRLSPRSTCTVTLEVEVEHFSEGTEGITLQGVVVEMAVKGVRGAGGDDPRRLGAREELRMLVRTMGTMG